MKSGNVSTYFDAEEAMKLRDLRSYEWKEFLVVWRKEQLELYEDYVSKVVFIQTHPYSFSIVNTRQRKTIGP